MSDKSIEQKFAEIVALCKLDLESCDKQVTITFEEDVERDRVMFPDGELRISRVQIVIANREEYEVSLDPEFEEELNDEDEEEEEEEEEEGENRGEEECEVEK